MWYCIIKLATEVEAKPLSIFSRAPEACFPTHKNRKTQNNVKAILQLWLNIIKGFHNKVD